MLRSGAARGEYMRPFLFNAHCVGLDLRFILIVVTPLLAVSASLGTQNFSNFVCQGIGSKWLLDEVDSFIQHPVVNNRILSVA